MLCCPITRQRKSYPFEVPLPSGGAVHGVVLSDHVKSIDWRVRQAEYIGTVPLVFFDEICLNINALLAG